MAGTSVSLQSCSRPRTLDASSRSRCDRTVQWLHYPALVRLRTVLRPAGGTPTSAERENATLAHAEQLQEGEARRATQIGMTGHPAQGGGDIRSKRTNIETTGGRCNGARSLRAECVPGVRERPANEHGRWNSDPGAHPCRIPGEAFNLPRPEPTRYGRGRWEPYGSRNSFHSSNSRQSTEGVRPRSNRSGRPPSTP